MAGMTCFVAIWAVLKTPHLTFFDTDHEPLQRMKERSGVVAARREAEWRLDGRMQLGKSIEQSSEAAVALACGSVVIDNCDSAMDAPLNCQADLTFRPRLFFAAPSSPIRSTLI
jgi:hypothetical protein